MAFSASTTVWLRRLIEPDRTSDCVHRLWITRDCIAAALSGDHFLAESITTGEASSSRSLGWRAPPGAQNFLDLVSNTGELRRSCA